MSKKTSCIASLILWCFSASAVAQTTYTYSGNTFDTITAGTAYIGQSISGSFVTDTPLGPNFSGTITPTSYSFTSGVATITLANIGADYFSITTDGNGQIVSWEIFLETGYPQPVNVGDQSYLMRTRANGVIEDLARTEECSVVLPPVCNGPTITDRALVTDSAGSWSVSTAPATAATPVPTLSLAGLILAGLGLLWFGGRRFRS